MKIKLKIQQKIQLFIIASSIIIYSIALGYISFQSRKMAYNDAIKLTDSQVEKSANNIKAQFDAQLSAVLTISHAFQVYKDFEKDEWQDLIHKIYLNVFKNNPDIYALWDSWELSAIDSTWDKSYGRISHSIWRENGVVKENIELRSLDGDSELYAETKSKLQPHINEPYFDVMTEGKKESLLMTSLNAPLVENGKYIGVVSYDITLEQIQNIIEEIKPYPGSYAFIISTQGAIAGHPDEDLLNKNIQDVFPEVEQKENLLEKIADAQFFSYTTKDEEGLERYVSYAPIQVKNTTTPWSIALSVPINTIMQQANRNFRISILVGIVGILLMSLIILIISKNITNPITRITKLLKKLAVGHLDEKMRIKLDTGDEIEEMADALNNSIVGLNNKADFANHIGKGNLKYDFKLLSDEDILGKSLIDMRNSLIKAKDEEHKRKEDDERRRWANEGLAKFADILRQNNDDIEKLATEIIMSLVSYLDANQGGLFILNDNDKENIYFELLSAYAFDRRKYLQKHIQPGEGLVGTCAMEKKTIFMTDIPQDYIEITSGLGSANPSCLLIVPLKLEDEILGVLEIASFNIFEKHEVEFVEKVAESIASTLAAVRINIRTTELLEKSQQQAEEMAAQEEEMRQNMEELQATQEESARKSAEMEGLIEALNTSSYVIEYDLDGYIQDVNDNYLSLLEVSKDEVIGTHHSGNMEFTEKQKAEYEKFWKDLRAGNVRKETTKVKVKQKELIFAETYTPIRNADGEVFKVLKISNNITEFQKNQ